MFVFLLLSLRSSCYIFPLCFNLFFCFLFPPTPMISSWMPSSITSFHWVAKENIRLCMLNWLNYCTKAGLLNLSTINIWGCILFLIEESCPVYCRTFSSIWGPYQLDVKSTPHPTPLPVRTTKNVSRCCQLFPGKPLWGGDLLW